jgi:RNA polymerase sigma-70 factor (ECF subfamily)
MNRSVSTTRYHQQSRCTDSKTAAVIALPRQRRQKPAEFSRPPEQDLVDALGRNDPDALEQVYDEHHEAVRAFCQRFIGEAATAEDLVHDTFISLPGAARRFRSKASLRSLLIGIAINHCRRHLRRARRRRNALVNMSQNQREADPSPDMLLRSEQARALSRALDSLSLKHRAVFVLCEVEQRSLLQVSQILGMAEGTIKSRLHYAKKQLQKLLKEVPR